MISVVIPLYNKASTIERAVRSVLAQTRRDFELLVVDDGSTDDGPQVVRTIDDPRLHIVAQTNAGVSAARNRGAELAHYPLVAYLDADDSWEPDHLAMMAAMVSRFPDAALYATAYNVVSEHGRSRPVSSREFTGGAEIGEIEDYFRDIVEIEHPFCSSGIMVSKRMLAAVGGFPVGVTSGEDLFTCARLACAGTIAYSRRPTATYFLPPISAGRATRAIRPPQRPDPLATELRRLHSECIRLAPSIRRFSGEWHRIRAMLFLELGARRHCLQELVLAAHASGLRRRDIASIGLLAIPLPLQQQILAWWRIHHGRV